jgi:elongation factor 1-gamma
MSFANTELLPNIANWFRPLAGIDPFNKKNVEDSRDRTLKAVTVLEQHFLVHTYLVGERPTLADLFFTSVISRGFQFVFDKQFRDEHPNTTRWFETIANQPTWKAVVDKPIMIDEAIKYTPPKKDPKPAKAAPAPAAKAPTKEKEQEEEEEEPAPAQKAAKHPLEALSKPTLILDDWKRKYSNSDTRGEALPWFWEQYKPDEYSLWRIDYKYNDELTMVFMSANLIGKHFLSHPIHIPYGLN